MKIREQHIKILDNYSKEVANDFRNGESISHKMIQAIVYLYDTANIEKKINDDKYSSAYHPPVTSDFEFLLSRLIFYIGELFEKGWRVDLRRQVNKATPDIRISKDDCTLWILELKVSMGWIRSFLCPTFYEKKRQEYNTDKKKWNPDEFNKKQAKTLEKYINAFSITKERIFFVVPSLSSIHYRKLSKDLTIEHYRNHFRDMSGLPFENLVIFNAALGQRLNNPSEASEVFSPTRDLENMLKSFVNCG